MNPRNRASSGLQPFAELSPEAERIAPATGRSVGLLDRLSESEAGLLAGATRVSLAPRQVLSDGELPMENVFLIETGLISVMAKVDKHRWVEAWSVGANGLLGLPCVLTDGHSANRRIVQVGGTALSIPRAGFRHLLDNSNRLRTVAHESLGFLLLQAAQVGVCNAQHSAMERVTRWLLLASHQTHERRISVAHDGLARAIGLRRATVSDCLKQLGQRRAVKTNRRLIEIADVNSLRSCSCACYRIMTRGRSAP